MYSVDKTEIVAAIQKYGAYKYMCIVADQSINQLFQIAFHYWIIYVHMQGIMHDHIIIWTFKWLKKVELIFLFHVLLVTVMQCGHSYSITNITASLSINTAVCLFVWNIEALSVVLEKIP